MPIKKTTLLQVPVLLEKVPMQVPVRVLEKALELVLEKVQVRVREKVLEKVPVRVLKAAPVVKKGLALEAAQMVKTQHLAATWN